MYIVWFVHCLICVFFDQNLEWEAQRLGMYYKVLYTEKLPYFSLFIVILPMSFAGYNLLPSE